MFWRKSKSTPQHGGLIWIEGVCMTSATSGDRKKFALPAASYRNTVSALKDDWQLYIPYGPLEKDRFPGDRRDSFQFFFDGQKLNEDDLIENIHSTRDKPIILHRPVYQVPCHDTHCAATRDSA